MLSGLHKKRIEFIPGNMTINGPAPWKGNTVPVTLVSMPIRKENDWNLCEKTDRVHPPLITAQPES